MAPPVAEIGIFQFGGNKGNAQESQGKGTENQSGASSSGKVSGADQVSDADRDYVEEALNPADDPLHEEWIDESGCIHHVEVAAGGQNSLGEPRKSPLPRGF